MTFKSWELYTCNIVHQLYFNGKKGRSGAWTSWSVCRIVGQNSETQGPQVALCLSREGGGAVWAILSLWPSLHSDPSLLCQAVWVCLYVDFRQFGHTCELLFKKLKKC